ncbi:MAG: hypothetical protein FJZ63_01745 [Chlamydiae bacterium]|nr:hypothetical protein [Chlamydiota bacterium]
MVNYLVLKSSERNPYAYDPNYKETNRVKPFQHKEKIIYREVWNVAKRIRLFVLALLSTISILPLALSFRGVCHLWKEAFHPRAKVIVLIKPEPMPKAPKNQRKVTFDDTDHSRPFYKNDSPAEIGKTITSYLSKS